MRDSRETFLRRAFVAGYPIRHSRSPLIHGHWLKQLGLAGSYEAMEIAPDDFPSFLMELKSGRSEFCGGNVTIPHKETAFRLADHPDERALELGAANTLWMENGALHATNTDGEGFTSNLDARYPGWDADHLKSGGAVVLGAGGAARAIVQAVRDRGFSQVHVVNRTVSRAGELSDRFGVRVKAHGLTALPEVMQGAGLFVNTTSLGMEGEEAMEIDFSPLRSAAVVTDIVYVPLITPLLAKARAQGFPAVDGLGMLLHQAVPGFEKWFGQRPVVDDTLRDLVIADMEKH